jgi:hypothetical protein
MTLLQVTVEVPSPVTSVPAVPPYIPWMSPQRASRYYVWVGGLAVQSIARLKPPS